VTISAAKGLEATYAKDLFFRNVRLLLPNGLEQQLKDMKAVEGNTSLLNSLSIKPHLSINQQEFLRQYAANKELWEKAFDYLRNNDLAALPTGKTLLAGDSLFVSVTDGPEKAFDSTKWESHQKYVDLQYIASGKERMGVANVANAKVLMPFNAAKDVANYEAEGTFFVADPSHYFIFFPQDAHRPSIKVDDGPVKKVVVKILAAR
jgi:YhcH/YjgK/YiaL family protein